MGIFSNVSGLKPGKTAFNLSHTHIFDCNFGELVPVACLETLPGDVFRFNADVVGRLTSALKSPILSQMDIVLEAFYCPTRLLMGHDANFETPVGEVTWEEFISGGKDGSHIGNESYPIPVYHAPTNNTIGFNSCGFGDHLGIQVGVPIFRDDSPLVFPWRAYRWIWNEFYRDENLMDPIQVCRFLGDGSSGDSTLLDSNVYDSILYRCWRKDYFTSALPFQQRGTSPALPISGVLPVNFTNFAINNPSLLSTNTTPSGIPLSLRVKLANNVDIANNGNVEWGSDTPFRIDSQPSSVNKLSGTFDSSTSATVDLANAATFDVNQIRTAFQVQKWLERNARGGVRYTEYLRSHFGVSPSDARLQRPQFIGSCRSPWLVNEVLQTSETNTSVTPQGNQAGQAINLSRNSLGKFKSYEYGYILILASVVPKALYQQGIPKYLSRKHNLDFYTPEFAHLSEQPVLNKEIYYKAGGNNNGIFGFQPIWNEMRFIPSKVTGHMRTGASDYSFDYWHFGRNFADTPLLNADFLLIGANEQSRQELMRVFAVQDENPFIINCGLSIKALRPMPYLSEPGLIDHF